MNPYIKILQKEMTPAIGCTEPIAIAYATARAVQVLEAPAESIDISVSANIMKNAMGVGIPGTKEVGIAVAAALGAVGGDGDAGLEVLHGISEEDVSKAKKLAGKVKVYLSSSKKKLYIYTKVFGKGHNASVAIEDSHTHIAEITRDNTILYCDKKENELNKSDLLATGMKISEIYQYVSRADEEDLSFLQQCIDMNIKVARYGMEHHCGLQVGKNLFDSCGEQKIMPEYAIALASAAADARMAGCMLPVMSLCGSGNQGLSATVPVIAYAKSAGYGNKYIYRALAMSCLITIHVKSFIGKLTPICGCGLGSAIGVAGAVTYLKGGSERAVGNAVKNMVGDVSGIICDGAKSSCALKISTVLGAAFRCADLAVCNRALGQLDGIVSDDVEMTISQLGILVRDGMQNTDRVLLQMMTNK